MANDCECLIECDGVGSLAAGEVCRADRLRKAREMANENETWLDGEWKRGPIQFGVCNLELGSGFLLPLISPILADRIILDHQRAQALDVAVAALRAIQAKRQPLPSPPEYGDWGDAIEYECIRVANDYADIADHALDAIAAQPEQAT